MNQNRSKKMMTIFALVGIFVLSSCAHSEKKLDEKVAQEKHIQTREELRAIAINTIQTAPGLNDEQRQKLLELRAATQASFDQIRGDTYKLEEALVRDVITTNDYNRNEVTLIKKRLGKLSDKRLSILSAAVDGASKILGRPTDAENQMMINEMIFEGHHARE